MELTPVFYQLVEQERLGFSRQALDEFCQKWQVIEFWLFGSVLRDDFHDANSDLDVLIAFAPQAPWNLLDIVEMEQALEVLSGRSVDLIEKRTIDNSENPIRKAEILNSARLVCSQIATHDTAR